MNRKAPTKQEKLSAALLALDEARCKLDPTLKSCVDRERAKTLSAEQVEREMNLEWAHVVHVAWDGDNHPTNLVPMRKTDHRRATEKTDVPAIAKVKRVAKKHAEHVCKMCPITPNAETVAAMEEAYRGKGKRFKTAKELFAYLDKPEKKKKWPSRPMLGSKASGLRKRMSEKEKR